MASPIFYYKFNDSNLGTDSSSSGISLTNTDVTLVTDPERGPVASFNGTTSKMVSTSNIPISVTGSSPRTFMYWIKYTETTYMRILQYGTSTSGDASTAGSNWMPSINNTENYQVQLAYSGSTNTPIAKDTWVHVTDTYDGTSIKTYFNGVLVATSSVFVNTTASTPFVIGIDTNLTSWPFKGFMSEYQGYDVALSATEVMDKYLNALFTTESQILSLDVTVSEVSGSTGYRLTTQETGSSLENITNDNFTTLTQTITGLKPDTEYTLRLYSTSGSGYELVDDSIVSTLENVAGNYDVNDFLNTGGRYDLTTLNTTSVEYISDIMNDLFTTGDLIDVNIQGTRGTKKSTFVNRGATSIIGDSEALIAPFSTAGGTGQSVSLTLSDTTTIPVAYNETTGELTIESNAYSSGDSLILDGKKVTIFDI